MRGPWRPSGLKVASQIPAPSWARGGVTGLPLAAFQTRAIPWLLSEFDPFQVAVSNFRPLGLKATVITWAWHFSLTRSFPVAASQIRAVPSLLAVATQRPSGLKTA